MIQSDELYKAYQIACHSGNRDAIGAAWQKWQDALIAEGKFHVKGKVVVDVLTGKTAIIEGYHG